MVHLSMLITGWTIALLLRWYWQSRLRLQPMTVQPLAVQHWADRWHHALICFLLPPLLLITTAIALLWMGPIGQMVHGWTGWLSYGWAIGFLLITTFWGFQLLSAGGQALQQMRQYPATQIDDCPARLLPIDLPFIAQIGFWQPQLLVSQGLLDRLDQAQLEAVLVHETAHQHYRDTFWFFWLGWLRRCSLGLPNTAALWQELLLLREMRADRWAAQTVNPLLLAEALLIVVSTPMQVDPMPLECAVGFNAELAVDRLEERINALLEPTAEPLAEPAIAPIVPRRWRTVAASLLVLLPLLVIPFHH